MIIGYARVNTQDKNTECQLDALNKAGCERIVQETLTCALRERPQLSQCLCDLHKGDTLIIWKLDMMAHSLKDLVEIVQGLTEREIGFRSLTESIDTTGPNGNLVVHLFGVLAEFEHNRIRERTMAGLRAARARGRKGGRKPAMSDSSIQEAVAMLSNPQLTKTQVAEHFGVTRTTLNASLKRMGFTA